MSPNHYSVLILGFIFSSNIGIHRPAYITHTVKTDISLESGVGGGTVHNSFMFDS